MTWPSGQERMELPVDAYQSSNNPAGWLCNSASRFSAACSKTSAGVTRELLRLLAEAVKLTARSSSKHSLPYRRGTCASLYLASPAACHLSSSRHVLWSFNRWRWLLYSVRGGFSSFMADYTRLSAAHIVHVITGHLKRRQQPVTPTVTVALSLPPGVRCSVLRQRSSVIQRWSGLKR